MVDHILEQISALDQILVDLADREKDTIMPGFTHLQVAQPVVFGHHLMAWREMIRRDAERFKDARKRLNVLPLGAAALAGTGFPSIEQGRPNSLASTASLRIHWTPSATAILRLSFAMPQACS